MPLGTRPQHLQARLPRVRSTRDALPKVGPGAAVVLVGALGCSRVPEGRTAVDAVRVQGADAIDDDDIKDKIATTESPKFLGLFRGLVYDYALFDRDILERDMARIEAFYRTKGFYDAHARAGRVYRLAPDHVRVEIVVEEG